MLLLKLESLPNEILLDFLEKHANGVDILVAFSKQLNSRIDDLIGQCQQFQFDFFHCRKDDFLLCVSLFPSLIDRITELVLSEWNTPRQIHTFLEFFPLFTPFKTLRTLYFHFDVATINSKEVDRALSSLSNLQNLNTLSIKVANESMLPLPINDEHLLNETDGMNHICGRKRRTANHQNIEFRTALVRPTNNNISPTNTITSLQFSSNSSLVSCQHFFDNVRYLTIYYTEKNLVQWITTYVNCLRIEELDISLCRQDQMTIIPLLTQAKNIKSLKLNADQLVIYQTLQIETNNQLKSLVLSDVKNIFNENIIQTIGQLFPRLEHIVTDLLNLNNIPMLDIYLPHLRSLTFDISDQVFDPFYSFKNKIEDYQRRTKTKFLFQSDGNWITIWLDAAVFEQMFWEAFRTKLCLFG
ncbi:unnamed protein product [Adineta steineri]|uniref:F-box domain-containing protein n=1 Tax=Adineta steineri TaxID=433720 RepID=A0A819NXK3_9BILA|nr:unnamed protein product [Adineta steineri]